MARNSIVKVLSGASKVTGSMAQNFIAKGQHIVEDHLLKQRYVLREEFENLQQMVVKLQQEMKDKQHHKE